MRSTFYSILLKYKVKAFHWIAKTFSAKKDGKLMYSVQEFSNISRLSENEIYELIKEGKVKALQIEKDGRYRISKQEIERFV